MEGDRGAGRLTRSTAALSLWMVCGIGLGGCADVHGVPQDIARQFRLAPPASPPLYLRPLASTPRNVFTRSYRVGESYTSRIGEPMLSVKNYAVTERVGRATALRDFEQLCDRWMRKEAAPCSGTPRGDVHGSLGTVFEVQGAVSTPDGNYFAVSVPVAGSQDLLYLLVDPHGRLRRGGYLAWHEASSEGFQTGGIPLEEIAPQPALDSDTPLFSFENQQTFAAKGPGYLNFDLVYAGKREMGQGETVFLTYREYARETTDQLLFEHRLQYPVSQREVEISGLRLHITGAGPDSITFDVIEDSQPGAGQS